MFYGLAVAGVSIIISAGVGFVFMTWLHSRFARVNWGVWGLLLGAPLVAIAKVVFDRVESLKRAGALLGQ